MRAEARRREHLREHRRALLGQSLQTEPAFLTRQPLSRIRIRIRDYTTFGAAPALRSRAELVSRACETRHTYTCVHVRMCARM